VVPAGEVERFRPTNGRFTGGLGLGLVAFLMLGTVIDGWHPSDALVIVALGLGGVLVWAVVLRPVVMLGPASLMLRHSFSTTVIPLHLVDEARIGTMLAVQADGRTHRSAALHRARRKERRAARRTVTQADRATPPIPEYADVVEGRIRDAAEVATIAHRRQGATDLAVRRDWAWPEILLAGGLALLALVLLVF